ncbi:MAG TPA: hypothetical protein VGQ04_16560, partial [Chitinophagaceae bacterium]|nr:hypothetical protein [Chitinophagaceae bacterium]
HLMKPLTATFIFILFVFSLSAQVLPIKNALQTDIAKVISDYPNGYKNIIGEQIMANPQSIEFECLVTVKDAIKSKLIKYSSNVKEIYSWEAEMIKTDDFETASKKFRAIYNSLQHLSVNINGSTAVFEGNYIKPSEAIKFTTIVLVPGDKTPELKELKLALVLETDMLDWVIKIQVYEREREDKDKGPAIDE